MGRAPQRVAPSQPGEDEGVPEYIYVADIVRVSKLSTNVVRSKIKALGVCEKLGNSLAISREELRDRWPQMYRKLLAKAAEGEALRPERPPPPTRGAKR